MPTRSAFLALAFTVAATTHALAQCAMCGNSFEPNDPATNAFNTSVLFMMLAPYSIFFVAAACIVWLHRRGALGGGATIIPFRRPAVRSAADPKEVTP